MFQQDGEGSIDWRKLVRVVPISPEKNRSLSQAVGAFGVRHCRYIGLAKTHLQHIATAAAINLSRLFDWLRTVPRSQTRQSRFAALKPLPQDSPSTQAWECGA